MAGHTPGPWVWRHKSGTLHRVGDGHYRYGEPVLRPVWEYDSGLGAEVSEEDAALIASSPDLLEALKGMADAYCALLLMKAEDPSRFQEPGTPYAKALAAISRAEGKGE